jgi:hypothetical protein
MGPWGKINRISDDLVKLHCFKNIPETSVLKLKKKKLNTMKAKTFLGFVKKKNCKVIVTSKSGEIHDSR